jgi:hypothetical protein
VTATAGEQRPLLVREFSLVPFTVTPLLASSSISGRLSRSGDRLVLEFVITGGRTAGVDSTPARRDGLWRRTCGELFVAAAGQPGYHELNLAPNGDWNLYRFDGYRSGGREEDAIAGLTACAGLDDGRLRLTVELPLAPLGLAGAELDVGVSAVLEGADGAVSHWALVHPAMVPDFHDRRAFTLRLPTCPTKGSP